MSYIADEVFSEEDNYYYSLGQYMMSKMISDALVELQMTINDKLEAIKGITVIADIVSILGMVAGGISKTGVTLSIPSVVQAGGTAVLGGSTVAISAEVVAAAAVAASEVIIVVSLAVGEVALVFCSANENASVQVKNSSSAIKKVSESGSNTNKLFKNQALLDEHYGKHGQEIADVLGDSNYSIDKYLDDANYIINNGTYVPELNGYVSFMSGKKYGFVGLDRTTGDITTFHIKNISELIKKAPSLGFER